MNKVNKILFVSSVAFSSVANAADIIKVIIPNDSGIIKSDDPSYIFSPYNLKPGSEWGRPTYQERLAIEKITDNSFIVHRRTHNGEAGSGIKYKVNYSIKSSNDNLKEITFIPALTQPEIYQQGLILKYPVPRFSQNDLLGYLKGGYVTYKFEVNSDYPVASIRSNFERLANNITSIENTIFEFKYNVVPYRNGSKILLTVNLKAINNNSDILDFSNSIKLFKNKINQIVNS